MATRHTTSSNDGSLESVLTTPLLKLELATIVALCSDSMRRRVIDIFEPINQPQQHSGSCDDLLIDLEEPVIAIEGTTQTASRLERVDQSDIQSPQAQGLRRAAVTHFDKWQIDVLRRVGEVLHVRPEAVRKARADAKAKAEAVAKAQRDQAYFDWANGEDTAMPSEQDTNDAGVLPHGFRAQILGVPKDKRIIILDSILLLLLSLEHYSAHSRVLMLNVTRAFQLPESTLIENESKVAEGLLSSAAAKFSAEGSTQRQASQDAAARRWKVGLATIAGAALIGVTGGIAAPFLAAGIGGVMGGIGLGAVATLLGPLATNVVLVGGLFGAYGGRMTGSIVQKYTQEIRDFKFLPVAHIAQHVSDGLGNNDESAAKLLSDPEARNSHKLRVAIGVSGSVVNAQDFVEPWKVFAESKTEAFGLQWEMNALLQLGRKISEVIQSAAWNFASYQVLSMVIAGMWPFGLLSAAKSLDSPFAIAKTRADKAGIVLADAMLNKVQGSRPVTLVGYGLGARVIYSCLLTLAEHNAFGLIESVVLMGSPTPSSTASWRRMRAVVSGRLINIFSGNDFLLGLLYRASSLQMGIAGVQSIVGITGVENYDATDMVQNHDQYKHLVGTLLQRVGFCDLDTDIVRQQQDAFKRAATKSKASDISGKRDSRFAKEIDDGRIVIVEDTATPSFNLRTDIDEIGLGMEKATITSSMYDLARPNDGEGEGEEEEADHQIRMEDNEEPMSLLAPKPETDFGPDEQTITFGTGQRGFNVEWSR